MLSNQNNSLVQASPEREHVYVGRVWYILLCDHDVIKTGPEFLEQKGKIYGCSTMYSTLGVCDICPPPDNQRHVVSCQLATFALFPVLSLWGTPMHN